MAPPDAAAIAGPPLPDDVHVPARIEDVAAPRYGSASLADLVPAVVARITADGGPAADTATVDGARPAAGGLAAGLRTAKVVVLVVDGLGSRQLARMPGVAPTLLALPGSDLDAAFPSTTVASLGSIGTGRPPSQHGLVGYCFAVPGHDHPLNGLGWRIGLRGGGFDARQLLVPEQLQPAPTAFEQAAALGVATTVVVDPDFPDSGLTRAVLRGGERRTARGLTTVLATAVQAVAAADGPALAYAHHPLVDWAGHTGGACSEAWADAVRDVDAALTTLRTALPPDVTVLVTADHGMLSVPEAAVVELSEHPALLDGVRVLAGEPRVRQLALEPDADRAEVAARWRRELGDRVLVATREQALPWFGPAPTDRARQHIGDLVVLARRGSLVHERVDPHGGRHLGQHGGPTRAERLVPLRRLEHT